MLFNSYVFIVAFLPITLIGFLVLSRSRKRAIAISWLVICSLAYYGWWSPKYLLLIIPSILANYATGFGLGRWRGHPRCKLLLIFGVSMNLGLIGYFKYANFFIGNASALVGADWYLGQIVLPLGISFFTFQQIAYLVDAYRTEAQYNLIDYALFVTFFPQLIAGPIVHHKEMLPQFRARRRVRFSPEDTSVGISMFVLGLCKKVILADSFATWATPVFTMADRGETPGLCMAWIGAVSYAFQLYFDFSGYSDMAIGLGRLFGIRLPQNFNSPYKALNIVDFWRRWHMTLSRFLAQYVYIPLGGNRKGKPRRYVNLMITMLLGGLWHGAGWTFVFWGGLHGLYLIATHGVCRIFGWHPSDVPKSPLRRHVLRAITFLAVLVAWVFFRATTFGGAGRIVAGMFGASGMATPTLFGAVARGGLLALTLAACWMLPNTQDAFFRYQPCLGYIRVRPGGIRQPRLVRLLAWRPSWQWAMLYGVPMAYCLMCLNQISEFIYYQF